MLIIGMSLINKPSFRTLELSLKASKNEMAQEYVASHILQSVTYPMIHQF